MKEIKPLHSGIKMLMVLICIAALVVLTLVLQSPPEPKSSRSPLSEFSSERAMVHLKQIAADFHPTGSAANTKVRQYLTDQLKELGLNTKVDSFNGGIETPYFSGEIELHNVIGVLKGAGNGKAVMLSAHYDSVATAYGANDNGAAVAALLEVARVLKAGPALKNDVWFVFTDAEEKGLIGSTLFWRNQDYIDKIGLTANFEARGSKGSSMMFQTSDDNGKLIREFAKASPTNPLANSFMGDLYKKLPNDTDFTISLKAGIPGFNFAYIDGWETYHTPEDSIEHVDLSSFQHQGENALLIARHFGDMDLQDLRSSNEVYFTFLGTFIHYSESLVKPVTVVLAILVILLIAAAWYKRLITLRGLTYSIAMAALCIIISAVLSLGLCYGIYQLWAERMTLFNGDTYDSGLYSFSFLLITMVVHAVLFRLLHRKINDLEFVLTGMLLFLGLLAASALYLPGASYLLTLPLLIHVIIVGYSLIRPRPLDALNHPISVAAAAFMPVVLFTTVFHLLFIGLDPYVNIIGVGILSILLMLLHTLNKSFLFAPRIFIPLALAVLVALVGTGFVHAINPGPARPVYQDETSTLKS